MMRKTNLKFTYIRDRKCEHCGKPIPDHLHDSRKHCVPETLIDGSIKNCKSKKNNEKAGIKNKEMKAILEERKLLLERVKKLVELKGIIVTTEDLDFHKIILAKSNGYMKIGSRVVSFFNGFKVVTRHWNNKHIIHINKQHE